jgi:predicted lipase
MKFIYCTCDASMLTRLTNLLELIEVNDYQIIDSANAKNIIRGTPFQMDQSTMNNITVTMQIPDSIKSKMILNIFRNINKENSAEPHKMLKVCSWEMDNYFFD